MKTKNKIKKIIIKAMLKEREKEGCYVIKVQDEQYMQKIENKLNMQSKYKEKNIMASNKGGKIISKVINKGIAYKTIAMLAIYEMSLNTAMCASDPTLVTKVNTALKKIETYLVKISIPAAGIAIASGVLMRKFSFGDEEKMAKGKKIIVNAIVGYAIISCIDLIIKFVDSMV